MKLCYQTIKKYIGKKGLNLKRQVFLNNGECVQLYAIEGAVGNFNNCATGCSGCNIGGGQPDVVLGVIAEVLVDVVGDVMDRTE